MSPLPAALAVLLAAAAPGARTYVVDPAKSRVVVEVGRGGLLGFVGHAHEVEAREVSGEVRADPADLPSSWVRLVFETAGLRVTGRGEPAADVPKVQEAMAGPRVLDAARFPEVTFRSTSVGGRPGPAGTWELELEGDLTLHGVTRRVRSAVHVEIGGDLLTASGVLSLRQTDHGMRPVSVAGLVKVKDALAVAYRIVARAAAGGS